MNTFREDLKTFGWKIWDYREHKITISMITPCQLADALDKSMRK
jgi:hypothetical protein